MKSLVMSSLSTPRISFFRNHIKCSYVHTLLNRRPLSSNILSLNDCLRIIMLQYFFFNRFFCDLSCVRLSSLPSSVIWTSSIMAFDFKLCLMQRTIPAQQYEPSLAFSYSFHSLFPIRAIMCSPDPRVNEHDFPMKHISRYMYTFTISRHRSSQFEFDVRTARLTTKRLKMRESASRKLVTHLALLFRLSRVA